MYRPLLKCVLFFDQSFIIYDRFKPLFEKDFDSKEVIAGYDTLSKKYGSLLTIFSLAQDKGIIEGIFGFKEKITDYKIGEIFTYLMLKQEKNDCDIKYQKI